MPRCDLVHFAPNLMPFFCCLLGGESKIAKGYPLLHWLVVYNDLTPLVQYWGTLLLLQVVFRIGNAMSFCKQRFLKIGRLSVKNGKINKKRHFNSLFCLFFFYLLLHTFSPLCLRVIYFYNAIFFFALSLKLKSYKSK